MEDELKPKAQLLAEIRELRERLSQRESNAAASDEDAYGGELVLDHLPYPAMLIRQDRVILATNFLAREMGGRIGGICWQDFGRSDNIPEQDKCYVEQHAGNAPAGGSKCISCRADEALVAKAPMNDSDVDAFGKSWNVWWVPVEDDVFLRYAIESTEHMGTKEMALASAARYHSLFDNAPIPLWEEDFSEVRLHLEELGASGISDLAAHLIDNPEEVVRCAAKVKVVDVNLAALELFGSSRAEEFRDDLSFALGQESNETFKAALLALWRGETMHETESVARTAARESIHIRLRRSIVPGYSDTWSKVIASIVDITGQAVAEEKSRAIIEGIDAGYFEADLSGNLTFFNDSWSVMLGYTPEELLGMNSRQYMGEENARKVLVTFNEVSRTGKGVRALEWHLIGKDGFVHHVEASVLARMDSAGHTVGFRGITRKITEDERTEDEKSQLIRELQGSLAQMRMLEGLIPICAVCKKVRDKDGDWKQIEAFVEESSTAQFSHGYCPECAKEAQAEFAGPRGRNSSRGG